MYQMDVYLRIRRAVMVDGMSIREVSRVFGLHRDTVRKILAYSAPPGYRRQTPPRRPKLEPFTAVIDQILVDDLRRPRKQRHTAQRIFQRLRDEHGFGGQYTIVKDYVREHRRGSQEMFVPLSHPPGHAQCDFGEALVIIGGVEQKAHCFVLDLPHSDAGPGTGAGFSRLPGFGGHQGQVGYGGGQVQLEPGFDAAEVAGLADSQLDQPRQQHFPPGRIA